MKINFLKGLVTGTRSTNELKPCRSIFLIKEDESERYREEGNGKIWSEADIRDYETNHPKDHIVIIHINRK